MCNGFLSSHRLSPLTVQTPPVIEDATRLLSRSGRPRSPSAI
jgi:hypothetical protein